MTQSASGKLRQDRTAWNRHGLGLLLLVTVFLLGITPITDGDVWWHLKSGEYLVLQRRLPENGPFVFTQSADRLLFRE